MRHGPRSPEPPEPRVLGWSTLWGGHLATPRTARALLATIAGLSFLVWLIGLLDLADPIAPLHALAAWSAAGLALVVSVFSAAHALANRDDLPRDATPRLLAMALGVTGLLHGTVTAASLLLPIDSNTHLTLWSVARTFLALSLAAGAWILARRARRPSLEAVAGGLALAAVLASVAVATGIFRLDALDVDALVRRPLDVPALIVFAVAGLLLFPPLHRLHGNIVAYALIISAIPQVLCQAQASFLATHPDDASAIITNLLESLAYACLLIGIAMDSVLRARQEQAATVEFETAQRELTKQTQELQRVDRELVVQASKRKRAERSLRMLEKAVETMSIGVTITDPKGTIIYVNPADAMMHGYQVSELLGADAAELTATHAEIGAPDGPPGGDEPWARETTHVTRDQRTFPVRLVSDVVRDELGTMLARVTTCEDITERREIERLKHEFISTVSHELRTPLTSIIASLGLLDSGALASEPEQTGEMITVAHRNSQRLLQLINDLLDLQKLDVGKITLATESVALEALLDDARAGVQAFADELDIQLQLEDTNGLSVLADRRRLTQVVLNLLSNAIKFSPAGSAVEIGGRRVGGRVVLHVTDHGPGIPREYRHRVFERFTQLDASPRRRIGGSGLGLTIAKELVEAMSGTITFDTELDHGTTFFVELPSA